jgi:type IV pilus assembly protein PilX
MLNRRTPQKGFVLIIALVALVILTLAAIGLIRTVSSSSGIAGNLAFEQAAATSADQAVEAAVTWLENNSGQASSTTATTCSTSVGATVLACDQASYGYFASRTDPSSSQTWSTLWTASFAANAVSLATDSAGNTAAYVIQRMCTSTGDASSSIGCSSSPTNISTTGSRKAGNLSTGNASTQVYYRITVKVSGPRNTISFTQTMVSL